MMLFSAVMYYLVAGVTQDLLLFLLMSFSVYLLLPCRFADRRLVGEKLSFSRADR